MKSVKTTSGELSGCPHTVGQALDPFILIKRQPKLTATRHHLTWPYWLAQAHNFVKLFMKSLLYKIRFINNAITFFYEIMFEACKVHMF